MPLYELLSRCLYPSSMRALFGIPLRDLWVRPLYGISLEDPFVRSQSRIMPEIAPI